MKLMDHPPPPWQLALARIEGALPFLRAEVADGLARASLRRLWRVHVRDFPQENQGPEHNPGLEAAELTRSWYAAERQDFLSWISRRAPPPLARAARLTLAAKDARESFSSTFAVNGQRTLHPTPHANSPDRQNSLHRRYFLTPFNIRAAALDDGASLRP